MEKRLFIGAIAGVIAGTLKDIPDAIFHYVLKITGITFWDYAGIIALGHHPNSFFEHVYSIIFQVIFSVLLGIIFINLTTHFKAKQYLLWGGFYGAIVWFAIRAAVVGMGIKPLMNVEIVTAVINSMDSIIYGLILGFTIQFLEKREKI